MRFLVHTYVYSHYSVIIFAGKMLDLVYKSDGTLTFFNLLQGAGSNIDGSRISRFPVLNSAALVTCENPTF